MPTNSGIMDGEPLGFGGLFDKFNFKQHMIHIKRYLLLG